MSLQQGSDTVKPQSKPQPKACGTVIDAQGREVEITEEMIQKACEDLEKSRVKKVHKG
ncbi:PA1571 family protein [Pseudomonas sp. NPDC089401]|uniref:PA1571 family protein n=1 Tax=Pseudomonas sp. NPDC089401 TaxID=3364462 RepID=UPI00380BF8E5